MWKKYACSICGYVYDEAKGIPEAGIAPGTKLGDLPNDWVAPCAAHPNRNLRNKMRFLHLPTNSHGQFLNRQPILGALWLEVSALCTNLARGCEKTV